MTVALLGRILPGRAAALFGRAGSVLGRNVTALKAPYWLALLSGFVEPLCYLFSIGIGVGALIGEFTLPDGRSVPYAVFVAPAMLAASAMFGALAETSFNFFGKLRYQKLYDGMLATPLRPMEIAIAELIWAMIRGTAYSAAFLALMAGLGLTTWPRAVAALPAAVAVGLAFGGLGLAIATWMRSWQDFDLLFVFQFALFLFSGTFVPAQVYPSPVRWLVELSPLYRGVDLIRAVTLGPVGTVTVLDVVYLIGVTGLGLWIAARRMERLLCG